MPDDAREKIAQKQKQTANETFIGSLMSSARMLSLYQPGHPMIIQIAERSTNLLIKTLGQDTTLVVDISGKSVTVGEAALTETKDITLLGGTLHTLGIGQVLFTNRVVKDGMLEFLKILVLKADEKNSLTAIQQAIQKTRIDGLQMTFVLSFVATGESEETSQKPGELSEEQITAFIQAETLPDFLLFLLKQNEPLNGKEAESVTTLLDNTLHRENSLEQFQEMMLWPNYDPRIRQCWDSFIQKQNWQPKVKGTTPTGGRQPHLPGWDRKSLFSQISLYNNADMQALQDRHSHEKSDAVKFCLGKIISVLENPAASVQYQWATFAYGRLLKDLGRDGDIKRLLLEFKRWQQPLPSGEVKPQFHMLVQQLQTKVLSQTLAENIVIYLSSLEEKTEAFTELEVFLPYLGVNAVPLFIEELRKLPDQKNRHKLCTLFGSICKRLGTVQPLLTALADEDWFVVRNIALVLGEINFPNTASSLVPLLNHKHQRVREEVIRSLGKVGDEMAIRGLGSFIVKEVKSEQAAIAIMTLSLLVHAGIDSTLIGAFNQIDHYETRISIVTALSRVNTTDSRKFLEVASKKSILEMITGRNKALRNAAKESLEVVSKGS